MNSVDLISGSELPNELFSKVCVELTFGPNTNNRRSDWASVNNEGIAEFSVGREDIFSSETNTQSKPRQCQFKTIIARLPKV